MAGTIQVKGNFFTSKDQKAAVPAFADRLVSYEMNGKGAFLPLPPRLATWNADEPLLHWQTEPLKGRTAVAVVGDDVREELETAPDSL